MDYRLSEKDLLLIAEAVLRVPYDQLEQELRTPAARQALNLAFAGPGELDLYPDPVDKAAICAAALIRLSPLPSGNDSVGYECMLEMLTRAGHRWPRPGAVEEIAPVVEDLERGAIGEAEFVRWVRSRVRA